MQSQYDFDLARTAIHGIARVSECYWLWTQGEATQSQFHWPVSHPRKRHDFTSAPYWISDLDWTIALPIHNAHDLMLASHPGTTVAMLCEWLGDMGGERFADALVIIGFEHLAYALTRTRESYETAQRIVPRRPVLVENAALSDRMALALDPNANALEPLLINAKLRHDRVLEQSQHIARQWIAENRGRG